MKKSDEERFWAKVDKSAGEDGCWEWKGHYERGSPAFDFRNTTVRPKNLAYNLVNGEIPSGFGVYRKCQNEGCFNPQHLYISEKVSMRFWKNVQIGNSNECWIWIGAKGGSSGYGLFRVGGRGAPTLGAHRVAYELSIGEIPTGLLVCHKCDNPPCVNPFHLFVGTTQDNINDLWAKGRGPNGDKSGSRKHPERLRRGELHPRAKLKLEDVERIRELWASGFYSGPQLGKMFNVHSSNIYYIIKSKSWKHIK